MEEFDVIIIGGGPVGCRVGRNLAKEGKNVLILEAKSRIGYPNHCSGLVPEEFISVGLVKDSLILNYIKGAKVYSYKENTFTFKREKPYAVVIDRVAFDRYTETLSKEAGAKIIYNSHVESVDLSEGCAKVKLTNGKEFTSKVLVVAAGSTNAIKNLLNFSMDGETIYTVQVDVSIALEDYEIAYIYMNNEIALNWFAWVIPTSIGFARVGFGTTDGRNILEKLDKLFHTWSLLKDAKIIGKPVVWSIPIGVPQKTVFKNVAFVGDSARQVKPFSGGGLLTGFIAGDVLSSTIINALNSKDVYTAIKNYEKNWRALLQGEFRKELLLREIYKTLTDEDKDRIIKEIDKEKIKYILSRYGKMDKPSVTGIKLLTTYMKIPFLYLKRKLNF